PPETSPNQHRLLSHAHAHAPHDRRYRRHRPRVHNAAGGRRGRALDGARKRRGGAPHLDFGPLCRWSGSAAA
ncbi:unnamed protein product, partial [Urochloa humidicola]